MSTKAQAPKAISAQVSKQKKPKASSPAHPPFKQLILEAIKHLCDKNGSSRQAIRKFIEKKYPQINIGTFLNKNLTKMTKSGQLKHPKNHSGTFLINVEKAEKKAKKTQKKKDTKKPKPEKKSQKKVTGGKKKTKSPAKKRTIKSAKKSPAKKAGPKKVRGPPSPKKSVSKGKKGRGRPKKK